MGLFEKLTGIFVGSISWSDLIIVTDIISCIIERRIKEGIEPDGIHSETFHIIKLRDDAL